MRFLYGTYNLPIPNVKKNIVWWHSPISINLPQILPFLEKKNTYFADRDAAHFYR